MLEAGADIIDIGGESTRPGAAEIPSDEEQRRIIPTIRLLARQGARISVDTRHADTMQAALDAGAHIINDVSGLRHDPRAAGIVAAYGCEIILMHMRGTPQTMTGLAVYHDVVSEVRAELGQVVAEAVAAGIARSRITIDPGIGFAKTAAQNLLLLKGLGKFASLGLPILIGVSRKSFIGHYTNESDPTRRVPGSIAAALFAGTVGASVLRVHDVPETIQALRLWTALAT